LLDEALAIREFPEGYNNRGLSKLNIAKYSEALDDFTRAIKIRPNFTEALTNRGNVYRLVKQYDRAHADLDRAEQSISNDATLRAAVIVNRGVMFLSMRQLEQATTEFDRAVSINSIDTFALNMRGLFNRLLGRYQPAIDDFTRALSIKQSPVLYNNRGLVYLDDQQYMSALEDFLRALRLQPNGSYILNNVGITLLRLDELERAKGYLERALRQDAMCNECRYNMVQILGHQNDWPGKIRMLEELIRLSPDYLAAYPLLVTAYQKVKRSRSKPAPAFCHGDGSRGPQ